MERYDVLVIGGGHAGCEAALASARIARTALLTENLDMIAFLRETKHLVEEISCPLMDALRRSSAAMPFLLDRILGEADRDPAPSLDPLVYHRKMKHLLERTQNLDLFQIKVDSVIDRLKNTEGVRTAFGKKFSAEAVILCTGSPEYGSELSVRYKKEAQSVDVKKDQMSRNTEDLFFAGELISDMTPVLAAAYGINAGICTSNHVLHPRALFIKELIDSSLMI
jgi:tRNA U34 5-carboxymethylaminomethyl modifying enzyme MnmG/GidA